MKKLLLAALLGLFGIAAHASTPVQVNNTMCPGANVTVQWYAYDFTTCAITLVSPVYPLPIGPSPIWDLDAPSTWGGPTPPSYSLYAAVVCISCPGTPSYCLPPIFVMPGVCGPTSNPPVPQPCCGSIADDFNPGSGGIAYFLNVHP